MGVKGFLKKSGKVIGIGLTDKERKRIRKQQMQKLRLSVERAKQNAELQRQLAQIRKSRQSFVPPKPRATGLEAFAFQAPQQKLKKKKQIPKDEFVFVISKKKKQAQKKKKKPTQRKPSFNEEFWRL